MNYHIFVSNIYQQDGQIQPSLSTDSTSRWLIALDISGRYSKIIVLPVATYDYGTLKAWLPSIVKRLPVTIVNLTNEAVLLVFEKWRMERNKTCPLLIYIELPSSHYLFEYRKVVGVCYSEEILNEKQNKQYICSQRDSNPRHQIQSLGC